MSKVQFIEAEAGDWVEVYVDGVLKFAGHKIRPFELLELLVVPLDVAVVGEDFPWAQMKDWKYPERPYPAEAVEADLKEGEDDEVNSI